MTMTDTQSETEKAFVERLHAIAPDVSAAIACRFGQDIGRVVLWKVRDAVEEALARRAVTPAPEPAAFDMAELRRLWEAAPARMLVAKGAYFDRWELRRDVELFYRAARNAFPAIDAEMTRLRERVKTLQGMLAVQWRLDEFRAEASADKAKEPLNFSDEQLSKLQDRMWLDEEAALLSVDLVRARSKIAQLTEELIAVRATLRGSDFSKGGREYTLSGCARTVECIFDQTTNQYVSVSSHRGVELCKALNPEYIARAEASADKAKGGDDWTRHRLTEIDVWAIRCPRPPHAYVAIRTNGLSEPFLLMEGLFLDPTPTPTGARVAGEPECRITTEQLKGIIFRKKGFVSAEKVADLLALDLLTARAALAPDPAAIRREAFKRAEKLAKCAAEKDGRLCSEYPDCGGDCDCGVKNDGNAIAAALRTLAGEPTP